MIYLDNAATSWPKPPQVITAATGVMAQPFGNPGRGGHRASLCAGRVVTACREALAEYLGVAPERVIFTLNCTDAINMALRGFLRRGDHVLVTHDAHNAVMRPLAGLEERGGITLTVLRAAENGLIPPESIREAVQPATSLCVLTHASNVTGTVQPVKAAQARPAKTCTSPICCPSAMKAARCNCPPLPGCCRACALRRPTARRSMPMKTS